MESITTHDLSYMIGSARILDHISLRVPSGSIYGYLGKNGAGKSTTIKLLLGLIASQSDNIHIQNLSLKSNLTDIHAITGNLIESPCFYTRLTVYENLKYLDIIYRRGEQRINEVLEWVGLGEQRGKSASALSMGMKQRLGIAIAIYHDPEILILDEPLNGLDPQGIVEMRNLFNTLNRQGKTIFLSSHILSELEKTATHIGIIDKGRMIFQGTKDELYRNTMTDTFYRSYASEFYKLSKNREIFGLLLLPAILIVLVAGYIYYDFSPSAGVSEGGNPWKHLLGRYTFQFLYLLYPILVAIFVHGCCDVEYKNNNYRILFTLPVSKFKTFVAKSLFMLMAILLSVTLAYFALLLCGYLLGIIAPDIGFQDYDFQKVLFYIFLKLYIALAAVSSVQLLLSLQFKNFIYPIGFGMFMLVFSMIVWQESYADFIPYTGPYVSYIHLYSENIRFERLDYANLCSIFVFTAASYFVFKKKVHR